MRQTHVALLRSSALAALLAMASPALVQAQGTPQQPEPPATQTGVPATNTQEPATEGPAVEEPPAAVAPGDDEEATPTVGEETVTVTGTRLRVPDLTARQPVTSVTGEAIRQGGAVNLTNFLQDLPALTGSIDNEDNADTGPQAGVGLNLLDLRNLGPQRTLVLVNGRRHVPGQPGSAAVDINTIPVSLVERVEILTGGASAIYGADGVSGVVNFILRDNFDGLAMRIQGGYATEGSGEQGILSIVGGRNFLNERANITVALESSIENAVDRDDRDFSRRGEREVIVRNPADLAIDDPAVPDRIFARNVTYIDSAVEGAVYTDVDFGEGLAGVDFLGDGTPWVVGTDSGDFTAIGGSGSRLDEFVDELLPQLDRQSINVNASYAVNSQLRFFTELKVARTETRFRAQPTFDFFLFVPEDNPFIPAAILADATGPNGLITAGEGGIYVSRDNVDLGYTGRDIERRTYRGVIGIDGDLADWVSYELSYTYGRTIENNVYLGNRINERWFAAIDAVDADPGPGVDIQCRSTVDPAAVPPGFEGDPAEFGQTFTPGAGSGCIPINIFGQNITPAGAAWITTASQTDSEIEQHVVTGFLSGDTSAFFTLPAGAVSWAVGAEYRDESSETQPSALELLAAEQGYDVTWSGEALPSSGGFDVWEVFAELQVPLIADVFLIDELTVSGAYRYSEYSTSGANRSYQAGVTWQVIEDVAFRATTARAVRAPNISELFTPNQQTFALLVDPCDEDELDINPNRAINCAAEGIPPTFNNTLSSAVEGRIGGNPDLDPEIADTITIGAVFTPTFIEGVGISVDYYEIELDEAIAFFGAQTILDYCYDLPQPNQFCPLIQRDPATFLLSGFQQIGVNASSYRTKGWDFTFRWQIDPADYGIEEDIGTFALSVVGNKLNDLTFVLLEDADPDRLVGDPDVPEWQVTTDLTWQYGRLTVNYGFAWSDETRRFSRERLAADPDTLPGYENYSAREIHDVQLRYDVTDSLSLYGGVNNLTNQLPDRGSLDQPVGPRGRFVYFGLSMDLGPDDLGNGT